MLLTLKVDFDSDFAFFFGTVAEVETALFFGIVAVVVATLFLDLISLFFANFHFLGYHLVRSYFH